MTANGIDVSNNNGRLDLAKFQGLEFVIAKVSEGVDFTDVDYPYYREHAKALGLHLGAYHFLHPESCDGKEEALQFLRHASLESGNSVWIDYESYSTRSTTDFKEIARFTETVKAHSAVKKVGLYANLEGFARVGPLGISAVCDMYWLAFYNGHTETITHPLNPYGLTWMIHQYEVFKGIDRDYSRVDAQELTDMSKW